MSAVRMHVRPFWLVVCCLLLAPGISWAADGRITELDVARKGNTVVVSAGLTARFPKKVVKEIRRGVPKDLFYTVTLNRRHRRFFDEELVARTVRFTIKYDTLESRFHIRREDPDGAVTNEVFPTWAAAVEAVSRIRGVHMDIPAGPRNSVHYVRVRAEMRQVRLPLYLNYVFFFIPILEFETPWARSGSVEKMP